MRTIYEVIILLGIAGLLFLGLFLFVGCEQPTEPNMDFNGEWRGRTIIIFADGETDASFTLFIKETETLTAIGTMENNDNGWLYIIDGYGYRMGYDKGNMNLVISRHGIYNQYINFDFQLMTDDLGRYKLTGVMRSDILGDIIVNLYRK